MNLGGQMGQHHSRTSTLMTEWAIPPPPPMEDPFGDTRDEIRSMEEGVSQDKNREDVKEGEEEAVVSVITNSESLLVPADVTHNQTEQPPQLRTTLVLEGKDRALRQRKLAVQEMVQTEQDYVNFLSLIVDGYIANMQDLDCEIKMPEDLRKGKEKFIFGNVEKIYQWHKKHFLKALQQCLEHPEELGPLFLRSKNHLYLYVSFCKSQSFSQHIVKTYLHTYFKDLKIMMGHKVALDDLMIRPVQRIMKYLLLLKRIYQETKEADLTAEAEILHQAVKMTERLTEAANGMMYIARIQGFDVKSAAQGQLVFFDQLLCLERKSSHSSFKASKGKTLHVFLLEQILIFSEAECDSPRLNYKNHIQVNQMKLQEIVTSGSLKKTGDVELFCVESTNPRRPLAYLCQAQTVESRKKWIDCFNKLFKAQDDLIKAITSPIKHQENLT